MNRWNVIKSGVTKRALSALLAALLAMPATAFAVDENAADNTPAASEGQVDIRMDAAMTVLRFQAEWSGDLDAASVMQRTKEIVEKRLTGFDCKEATVQVTDDTVLTVSLPSKEGNASAELHTIAEKLAQPAALSIQDSDGKEWLTNADLAGARAVRSTNAEGGGQNAAQDYMLTLSFTDEGAAKFAETTEAVAAREDGNHYLAILLDGKEIARPAIEQKIESDSCTVTHAFTKEQAEELAVLLDSGAHLAVLTLNPSDEPASDAAQPEEPPADRPEDPDNPSDADNPDDPDNPSNTDAPDAPSDADEPDDQPAPDISDFTDIEGHWAKDMLIQAVSLGMLQGKDGKLMPDNPVKFCEAIVILNRVLGEDGGSYIGGLTAVPSGAWYANDLAAAVHSGLVDAQSSRNFNASMTRAEAFELLARAFVYADADYDAAAVNKYPDAGDMTDAQRRAVAVLAPVGVISGNSDGTLRPKSVLTRAQFIAMLLRIAQEYVNSEPVEGEERTTIRPDGKKIVINASDAAVSDSPASLLAFGPAAKQVSISNVKPVSRISLKGVDNAVLAVADGTSVNELALDPSGTLRAAVDDTSEVDTLVVAGKDGRVEYQGPAREIDITSSGRAVELSGLNAARLTITGSSNNIAINGDISNITIASGAKNNHITFNGKAGTVTVSGVGTTLGGRGHADTIDMRASKCTVTLTADSQLDNVDKGLSETTIILGHPTRVLPGGSLFIVARFEGVDKARTCTAQWYQDGKPLDRYKNSGFSLAPDVTSRITLNFTFTRDMPKETTVGFKLTYENPSTGETEEKYEEVTVPIENYSEAWYFEREAGPVLKKVSSVYRGNYTAAYAINNDYTTQEKEIFVNAKGYSSSSQYLLWINRAYQHVNAFTGSKGNWKLVHSFLVGTGASGTPTPTGITTVSYKSAAGWTTGSYTVRPVVGFYPGTGYAFHSRLCYPGTDTEYDYSGGYPVSHGCVRMNKADVRWIYNNVPVGTTVVIF